MVATEAAKMTIGTAKKALQSVIAPDMNEIKTSLRVLDTKLDEMDKRLNQKIDMSTARLEQKIDCGFNSLNEKMKMTDKRSWE